MLSYRPAFTSARHAAVAVALALVCCAASAAAPDPRLDAARAHLQGGRAAQAAAALDRLETELGGTRDFDILFAQALLDAGQPARALFPINRLTAANPDDPVALLLLSRARIALGQADPAREALERVGKSRQPPGVVTRVNEALSIIAAAEEAGRTRFGGQLEIAFGYDSNVNSATGATQLALPVFGGAIGTLNATATRQSSGFGSIGGSVGLKHPLTADLALVASAGASQRWNFSADDFDLGSVAVAAGLRYTAGSNEFTVTLNADRFDVDYRRFRSATGGSLQWRHVLGRGAEISAFAQFATLDYPSQPLRDADRAVIGLAMGQALGTGERPMIVFATVYTGKEDERSANVAFFGHDLIGSRVGIEKSLSRRFGISASLGVESRDYGGADPLFLIGRFDTQWDLIVAFPYAMSERFALIPQVSHTYNKSNIELFKYRRTAASIAGRLIF